MSQAEITDITISERRVDLISRADALSAGMTRFFTGRPCKYGHIAERRSSNSVCLECKRAHENAKYADPVKRTKIQARNERYRSSEQGQKWTAAYASSDTRRSIHRAADKKYKNSPNGRVIKAAYEKTAPRKKALSKYSRLRNYGLSHAEYEALLESQQCRCAICRTDAPSRTWHVDHCHATGAVRGLLCPQCNVGLGHFKDSPELLSAAGAYLMKERKTT